MKRFLCFALPLLAAGGSADAQSASPPVSVSLGVFAPAVTDTRHRAGNALLLGSLRYALPAGTASPARTVVEGTAAYGKRGSEASTLLSLTGGRVFSLTPGRSPLAAQTVYAGAGAGVYALDLSGRHAFGRLGVYGEAGYNLTGAVFAQASYRLVERGSGASLAVGARF